MSENPTFSMKLKAWTTPNFANIEMPPTARQNGFAELPSIPISALPESALDALVEQWRDEVYRKAGKVAPEARARKDD